MNKQKLLSQQRIRRQRRARAKLVGTSLRPRLSVFRSLKHISAQLIDDAAGRTLVSVTDNEVKAAKTKTDQAMAVGQLLAEKAQVQKITTAVFDKGAFKYHGRVKAVAEGARAAGLKI
jgi:large subunit ribosomal protein L18